MSEPATGIAPERRTRIRLRWIVLALVLVFLAAAVILPLINISRYHRTIAESLSHSIGRPIHLGSVQLQLLPRPGLAITDFVVEEDPGFGAEPILRAPSVTVTLRLSSLWRERLEASTIDLDNASVNLVRNDRGQWNFGSLLLQAARTPNAPTAQRHATAQLRFPYIEFRSARINFKNGAEKKPFSFINADLSIWLDQPNQWRVRFEAQPVRTDLELDLADTGLVRLDGSVSRAPALEEIPVKLHAEWDRAPLGQVSRMLFGQDSGWRGLLRSEADITGDIRNLQMNARLRIDDPHRQEFTPATPLNVDVRCRAAYRPPSASVDDLTCIWPVADGHLLLTGALKTQARPEANLTLEINRTPAAFAMSALGMLRRGITPSLAAAGLINGHFTYANGEFAGKTSTPALSGEASVDSLSLNFPGVDQPLVFPVLRFVVPGPPHHAGHKTPKPAILNSPSHAILLSPAPLTLGALTPVELSGQFTRTGFILHFAGQADLLRLAALSKSSGLLGSSLARVTSATTEVPATADLDLNIAGPWMTTTTTTPATALGSLRIEHAQAKLDWLPEPVEIASATANFSPEKVTWSNATFAVNGIAAHGSFSYQMYCDPADNCGSSGAEQPVGNFNLDIPALDAVALESALIGAGRHNELLSVILAQVERKAPVWPSLEGAVHVGTLTLRNLTMHDARAVLHVKESRVEITSLDASTLGGSVNIAGSVDTSGSRPLWSLNLNWSGVSVPQVAAIFHEKWGAGTANGAASLTLDGYSTTDLAASARGAFHWDWARGSIGSGAPLTAQASSETSNASVEKASLTGVETAKFSPAHFPRWHASGTISDRTLKFDPADRTNPVTGTISFDRELDLSWPAADEAKLRIGGTLAHPVLQTPPRASPPGPG